MTRLTLAEVQALAGFTDGPWRMSIENGSGVVAGHRHAIVSAYSSPLGWPCVRIERASGPLVLAAPDLHADCLALHAAVAERDELLQQVETLTAERDRRIDPVEHARAVMETWRGVVDDPPYWPSLDEGWRESDDRAALLARVGADVLAEVER